MNTYFFNRLKKVLRLGAISFLLPLFSFLFTACEDVPMPFNNPELPPEPDVVVIDPVGDGTKENPFNVAGVLQYLNTLGADVESTKDIYVQGVVTAVKESFTTQYGNATFDISDTNEGTNKFTFYRGYYFGNQKYKNENDTNIKEDDVVVICGKVLNYQGNKPETSQNKAYVVSINGKGSDVTPSTGGDPKGSGTLADPYNATAANAYIASLAADTESDKEIYVKGKIIDIEEKNQFNTTYGNATFYISDDGTEDGDKFYVFRTYYLGNKKYESGDLPKKGDEVIICGKVINYKGNTPETVANKSYIYSLNGKIDDGGSGGGDTPATGKGSGTLADPYDAAAANAYIASLAADTESDKDIYVKGKIIEITDKNQFSVQYGNCSFYISNDGTDSGDKFYVFRTYYLGNVKYTDDSWAKPKAGDEVIICGKVINYKGNTPETVANKSYIYSLNGKTDAGGGGGSSTPDVGSIDKPKTCTEALAVINALEDGATTDDAYYVKGKITKIVTAEDKIAQYKNIDYWISDGTSEIEVFRGKNIDNTDFTGPGQINVGDEVIVLGKLQKYVKNGNMTPEIAQGNYIVKYTKGSGGGGGETAAAGTTADNPFTPAQANAFIATLEADKNTETDYYIKGKIIEITDKNQFSTQYGNCSFYISDDGKDKADKFYVYRTYYLGNVKYTDDSWEKPKAGDEVIICGKLVNYKGNTPETVANKNYIYSLNGKTK